MSRLEMSKSKIAVPPMPKDTLSDKISPALRAGTASDRVSHAIDFLTAVGDEVDGLIERPAPSPHLKMLCHVVRGHLEGRMITASSAIAASGVPYATANRRLAELIGDELIEQRAKTRTGKSFTLHPSARLMDSIQQLADRLPRLAAETLSHAPDDGDYYFGGSYRTSQVIGQVRPLPQPLKLAGGLKVLVHGDPTFLAMSHLKRQFEQIIGCSIHQRAFSIDRLRAETLRDAARRTSRYDIIAVDLPWIGEFATQGVLTPLDEVMDIERLDPSDFHTAGWQAAHWDGRPYGVPNQTTPELLFYRKDLFAEAGLEPPATTEAVLAAAKEFHKPTRGRYGIAWNAARGTALGHQFMMACAGFGQPVLDLPKIAGGFEAMSLAGRDMRPMFDQPHALMAAEYLLELMRYSPPDILSMSWYERVRPYAAGTVAMAYGYTLLAPYFEADPGSPARDNTGYLPHPSGAGAPPVAPVGGYLLGIPANIAPERRKAAAEALISFTSAAAQKQVVTAGSRSQPRYSVGADPEVRALSPIFEAVDGMSWRDELQFWPRPPVPGITEIIQACGEELHDMLRGITSPRDALARVQARAEIALKQP
ncbi:ABC transporter substrate-binding protein [Palleronia caenipelagi]|uniref:Extracellular solute-binding protein n=1 Tax=Palleronia caenipelagi TaxID=2489174 RepID=A0A547Q9Z9_9RHOB|nr:extracellular solute-binding protein [Palleronia caenipelagi]TRD23215.1 extracellular solute-binding protein [Palleronia caenipelagi]